MTIEERYKEAKKKHWGIFCNNWATCTNDGECSEACPFGGVADDTPPTAGDNKIQLKW